LRVEKFPEGRIALHPDERADIMKAIFASALALMIFTERASADPAGELLAQVAALHSSEITDQNGFLFLSWLQFDEDDLTYVLYLNDRKYDVILDDGRGTSQRAQSCKEENFFDENPRMGCPVNFDAEYLVEDNGGNVTVSLKIWNVTFQD
jgi:hypothetical protein